MDMVVWPDLEAADRKAGLKQATFVTFLQHGDRLHPSAAAWLAIERTAGREADVVAWGELQPDGAGGVAWAQRNPSLQLASLLHFPYLRNAFAVSTRLAAVYSGNLARETLRNQLHLFQIWLARRDGVRWFSHPEFFLIRADALVSERPEGAARRAYAEYAADYAALFETSSGEFAFMATPRGDPAPYRLTPQPVPGSLSIIIPFRDKPELTARAVRSISRQQFPGSVEIVLVNNQSAAEAITALRVELSRLPADRPCRIVDYDAPFNHSAQCALGVRECTGAVVLFMNNDAELQTANALTELAAWAARPGVASVGAAIANPQTGKVAAGMEARLAPTHYFDSIVEERSEAAFTPFVREVFGNSFAFAAISRLAFDAIGGLDSLRFPNGYNDVEFACRARRKGYTHVSLGHLMVRHEPGQSRGRTDETVQKILLRTLYPEASAAALTDLRFDGTPGATGARPRPKGQQ
ncbi:MAG: glycosyltransferase [Candidatus Parcubacteria bacterium]|nr:glycosyltransferase [Burkholderiales bacterium]